MTVWNEKRGRQVIQVVDPIIEDLTLEAYYSFANDETDLVRVSDWEKALKELGSPIRDERGVPLIKEYNRFSHGLRFTLKDGEPYVFLSEKNNEEKKVLPIPFEAA